MDCPKCGSLLHEEEDYSRFPFRVVLRCLICGYEEEAKE